MGQKYNRSRRSSAVDPKNLALLWATFDEEVFVVHAAQRRLKAIPALYDRRYFGANRKRAYVIRWLVEKLSRHRTVLMSGHVLQLFGLR
jgi:hypothetical protein